MCKIYTIFKIFFVNVSLLHCGVLYDLKTVMLQFSISFWDYIKSEGQH